MRCSRGLRRLGQRQVSVMVSCVLTVGVAVAVAGPANADPIRPARAVPAATSVEGQALQATSVNAALRLIPAVTLARHPEIRSFLVDPQAVLDPGGLARSSSALGLTAGVAAQSGGGLPSCPAQGGGLLAGFPAPFGFFPATTLNNFCAPMGIDDGCSGVPSSSFFYDFRAACRQHDLGYRWTPASRSDVDDRLFADAAESCALGDAVWYLDCITAAGIVWAGVVAVGSLFYGTEAWAGYNRPLHDDGTPDPLPAAPSCAQPTHVWVATDHGAAVQQGAAVYVTGVVRSLSRVRFHFRDGGGNELADHLTYFSDAGCVVHQERFDTAGLPVGPITVSADYQEWESNTEVTRDVTTLNITPAVTCGQASGARVVTPTGTGAVTTADTVYLTGVVTPHTTIEFTFADTAGAVVGSHRTQPAADNCVVAHEPESYPVSLLPAGAVRVDATYLAWETGQPTTMTVANLTVTATATLTVRVAGPGSGVVTSDNGSILCSRNDGGCSATVPVGSQITLDAAADDGSDFAGWSGNGCTGTGSCTVTINGTRTVTARFTGVSDCNATTPPAFVAATEHSNLAAVSPGC